MPARAPLHAALRQTLQRSNLIERFTLSKLSPFTFCKLPVFGESELLSGGALEGLSPTWGAHDSLWRLDLEIQNFLQISFYIRIHQKKIWKKFQEKDWENFVLAKKTNFLGKEELVSKIQFSLLSAKIVGFPFWLQILPIQTNAHLLRQTYRIHTKNWKKSHQKTEKISS